MEIISQFKDEYRWLSNFYKTPILYNGYLYMSSEAAYQAHKSLDENVHREFTKLTAGTAKELGQELTKRPDWDEVKVQIMYEILCIKFEDRVLRKKLLDTGDVEIVEGNWWHDNTWGDCICSECIHIKGENALGEILMRIRKEIRNEIL